MPDTRATPPTIDTQSLLPVVVACLGVGRGVELADWRCDALGGGLGGQAVFRVAGTATVDGEDSAWSVVLKVLRRTESNAAPDALDYWRREREAIRTGLADGLPDGLGAPRCLGVADRSPEETWLWFEDLGGCEARGLTTVEWTDIARDFGRWQGRYLTGTAVPDHGWLCGDWLERWCLANDLFDRREDLPRARDHPLVRRMYPGETWSVAARFWRDRDLLLDAYRRLPRTVAHLDAYRRNVFVVDGRAVIIDWAIAGIEPAGAELCSLTWTNIISQEVPAAAYDEFDRALFAGYLAGLRDVGWDGDPRVVRFAAVVACCLRAITPITRLAEELAAGADSGYWGEIASFLGADDLDGAVEQVARGNLFISDRVAEAFELLDHIDLA
jgi:hypothetical protein